MTNNTPEKANKETILVVGDFFLDENWLMARCDNLHSTNVGDAHYRSLLNTSDSMILSLCGIANVLKILSGPQGESISPKSLLNDYRLVGVGVWNPKDEDVIKCILCQKGYYKIKVTPYTLKGLERKQKKSDNGCPYSKNGIIKCDSQPQMINLLKFTDESLVSTNRLYRIYEGFGSDQPKLLCRYDWQMKIDKTKLELDQLDNIENSNVTKIIIVDHGKEVIGKKLVKELYKRYPNAEWYIRIKQSSPPWLNSLIKNNIRLKLIITDEQMIKNKYGVRKWAYNNTLGRGSLEILGDLLGLDKYQDGKEVKNTDYPKIENAAILFEDNSAIAGTLMENADDANVVYIPAPQGKIQPIRVGRTSIFFNSLIYWDLSPRTKDDQKDIGCEYALNNMYQWTKECSDAWMNEEINSLSGPFDEVITWGNIISNKKHDNPSFQYKKEWDKWNNSSNFNNLFLQEKIKKIQLWRGYGILDSYMCPGGPKRTSINNLVNSLNTYNNEKNPKNPYNCLFLAEPGWGKSYLAECLSKHFDYEYLEYSIAQKPSAKDLIDDFKEIASTQKRISKKVLVFIDEIDAEIEGHEALSLLLGPMWNGNFKTERETYKIDPCIWVFASTKPLDSIRKLSKGRDFLSRINGDTLNLDYLTDENREKIHERANEEDRWLKLNKHFQNTPILQTELVYLGINILNKKFGTITHIDREVLRLFFNIFPENGIRSLSIFVSYFSQPIDGKIRKINVPDIKDYRIERHIKFPETFQFRIDDSLEDMVKIYYQPRNFL